MCKFYSAILTKTGELYHNSSLTSHEDIISLYKLKDHREGLICRVEFYPDDVSDIRNVDKYILHVDEERIPDWFEEFKERTIEDLKIVIKNLIITEDTEILINGGYVLSNGVKIKSLKNSIVYYAGSATIENADSATIVYANSATIVYANSATIKYAGSATIKNAGSATIKNANSATIKNANSATIENANSATIENANSATIKNANNATIEYADSATITK